MKMTFVGCGSAFNKKDGQSNVLVESQSGKKLLIDCGSYFWKDALVKPTDIDSVYISHLHADHVGGLEELAFCTYFTPNVERPKLFCNTNLMKELWEETLQGGLASIQGKVVTLTEYFDCHPVSNSDSFLWEGIKFTPIQTVHVMAAYHIKYSYGLMIQELSKSTKNIETYEVMRTGFDGLMPVNKDVPVENKKVFFTADTQHCPNQIMDFYKEADVIFQDCETAPYNSGVHASYNELKNLPDEVKQKMWLYHYQENPPQKENDVSTDGFAGFVEKGQSFDVGER